MSDLGFRNKQSIMVQVGSRSGPVIRWNNPEVMEILIRTDMRGSPSMYSFIRPGKLEWMSFTPEQYKDGVFESNTYTIKVCEKTK